MKQGVKDELFRVNHVTGGAEYFIVSRLTEPPNKGGCKWVVQFIARKAVEYFQL